MSFGQGETAGNSIILTDENGEETEFFIIDETRINGKTYILATDSEEDGGYGLIFEAVGEGDELTLKEVSDEEYDYIANVFAEENDIAFEEDPSGN